ncbi:hypothetical protein F8344_19740 [Salmonella enterica]|nr:hypothetical protein [Salmonella enterica]
MINIISDMISCVLLDYHIGCWFSAAQIRFLVVTDLSLPPHNATSCKHNMSYCIQLLMTLYVVLFPLPVMRRAGAENSDMMISSVWYTSGKLWYSGKSDLTETALR